MVKDNYIRQSMNSIINQPSKDLSKIYGYVEMKACDYWVVLLDGKNLVK